MTGRLPFDPDRMAKKKRGGEGSGEPSPPSSARDEPMRVGALCARLDTALKAGVPERVRVVGQVSGFTERTHWYFQLKEEGAVIGAVMFASAARRASVRPTDGMEVTVSGRVEFHAPSGRVSLIVDSVREVGVGALETEFRALCAELRGLGWFEDARKRPVPIFPRRVAVVTSRTGAAVHDVIATARARCPAVELAIVDVRVQGASAAPEIAHALRTLSDRRDELGIDAVLVTRGGGSMEDLWAFNERGVARAIADCELPVVAAIGHESDTTIAELVADVRCSTPTQAAVRLVPEGEALARQIETCARRARDALRSRVKYERQRLDAAARAPVLADPRAVLRVHRERVTALLRRLVQGAGRRVDRGGRRVDGLGVRLERHRPAAAHARRAARVEHLGDRLRRAIRLAMERARADCESLARELDAVGPGQVLARGYSVTLDAEGRPVRTVSGVHAGQRITTRVSDGAFESEVRTEGSPGQPLDPPPSTGRKRTRRSGGRGQMDLFGVGG